MEYDHILIRYGEIALKGKNKRSFEEQLIRNIRPLLSEFPNAKLRRSYNQMYVELNGEPYEPIIEKLKKVFGIQSLSVALKSENDVEQMQKTALAALELTGKKVKTFKVSARRKFKQFPIDSLQLNHLIGSSILKNVKDISVDVHNPDVDLRVEVKSDGTYISSEQIPGAGGLPVGSSGKVLLMLSGGIDSPVAGYLALKRGVTLEAIHFHSPPYTSDRAKQKVEDLVSVLATYGLKINLHIVPFTLIQQEIKRHVPDDYSMTIMRRMMLRISEQIARKQGALAIVTGESIGQVASQTIESMHAINAVTTMPVLRPLVAMDKLEIMEIAKQINTYDISIRPYEDCCTIFLPTNPVTRPKLEKAVQYEQALNIEELVNDAVKQTTMTTFSFEKPKEETPLINELF